MGGYSCTCLSLGVHLPALPRSCMCLSTQNHIYFAPSPPVHAQVFAPMLPDTQVMLLEVWGGKPRKQSSRPAACQRSWGLVCFFCLFVLHLIAKICKSCKIHLSPPGSSVRGTGTPPGQNELREKEQTCTQRVATASPALLQNPLMVLFYFFVQGTT